jgi:probable rRNA maturation factor
MRKLFITMQDAKPTREVRIAAKRAAKIAGKLQGQDFRVGLMFTDDANMQRLNAQFREVDAPTDVLSFPSGVEDYLGDIAISLERAGRQAEEFGQSLEREVAFLTAHAMLHLFGYDHVTEEGEQAMRAEQRRIMELVGL